MDAWGYALLGGIGGGAGALEEQRKREAEEAKAQNIARFQQQLQQENYSYQDRLQQANKEAEYTRAKADKEAERTYNETQAAKERQEAGTDKDGKPLWKDKFGNIYDASGNKTDSVVYEGKLKRPEDKDKLKFSETYTDASGNKVAYDPSNPSKQFVIGKDGNYKPKGELSEAGQLAATKRLSEINEEGVTDNNLGEVNAIRSRLGMPSLKKVEATPAKEGSKWNPFDDDQPATYEYKEDWEGFEKQQKKPAEILPSTSVTGGTDPLVAAVRQTESGGRDFDPKTGELLKNPNSSAQGGMQVLKGTAGGPGFGIAPADLSGDKYQDAKELNRVGEAYLKEMVNRYDGDVSMGLLAYTWGPGNVDKWVKAGANPNEIPPDKNSYVSKTLAKYEQLKQQQVARQPQQPPQIIPRPGEAQAAMVPPQQGQQQPQQQSGQPPKPATPREVIEARAAELRALSQQNGQAADNYGPIGIAPQEQATINQQQQAPPDQRPMAERVGAMVGKADQFIDRAAGATNQAVSAGVETTGQIAGTIGDAAIKFRDEGEKLGTVKFWQQLYNSPKWGEEARSLSLAGKSTLEGIMAANNLTGQEVAAYLERANMSLTDFIVKFGKGYASARN